MSCAYLCRWRDPWPSLYCVMYYWCWPKSEPWNRSSCVSYRINMSEPVVCITLTACSVDLPIWWVTVSRRLRLCDWWVLVLQIHATRKKYFWRDHFFCTKQMWRWHKIINIFFNLLLFSFSLLSSPSFCVVVHFYSLVLLSLSFFLLSLSGLSVSWHWNCVAIRFRRD